MRLVANRCVRYEAGDSELGLSLSALMSVVLCGCGFGSATKGQAGDRSWDVFG